MSGHRHNEHINCTKIFSPVVLIHDLSKTGFPKRDEHSIAAKNDSPRISECQNCSRDLSSTDTAQLWSQYFRHQYEEMTRLHPLLLRHMLPTDAVFRHRETCVNRSFARERESADQKGFTETDANKLKPKEKPFACPFCSVKCRNRGQLRGHIRIHTGERPYICQATGCNKSFKRKEELTRHNRIHTDERPHTCCSCGKSFTRKDHLSKHMQIHNNDEDLLHFIAP